MIRRVPRLPTCKRHPAMGSVSAHAQHMFSALVMPMCVCVVKKRVFCHREFKLSVILF